MILFVLAAVIAVFLLAAKYIEWLEWLSLVALFLIVVLGTALFMWPISYYKVKSDINAYYVTKQTIAESRKGSISDVERATLTNKIIEINQHIASLNYWNNSILDCYVPDEVGSLEYLK